MTAIAQAIAKAVGSVARITAPFPKTETLPQHECRPEGRVNTSQKSSAPLLQAETEQPGEPLRPLIKKARRGTETGERR